jgi:hypothetical protein
VQHVWCAGLTFYACFGRSFDLRHTKNGWRKARGRKPAKLKGLMMKEMLFALSLGFGAVILVTQAQATPQCGPRDLVVAQLAARFGETRRAIGIAANSMVMETYASEESQSWTITVTSPEGETCLIASGQGFEAVADPLPVQGEPA